MAPNTTANIMDERLRPEIPVISVSLSDAYERGRTDINFFAALCIPEVFIYALPPFYIAAWSLLVDASPERIDSLFRFALGLPRGHAKTTFIKVLIVWVIVYDYAKFILIICSNSGLAENVLADIDDILSSDNITSVYGAWESTKAIDSSDTKKASYHGRAVTLVARGWSAGVRGLNLKHQRPDFIFCDDVQTKENDSSISDSAKLLGELVGSIFHAVAHRGRRTIVYVGNLYSETCILQRFRENPHWTSLVTGAILEDGQPLWPELVSLKELKESYEHDEALGLAHIWFAEIMNDPQSLTKSIFPHPLPSSEPEEIVEDDGAYITIDPAGFRLESDDNVIVGHKKFDNKGYIVESSIGIKDPMEIIKEAISMALRINASLIAIESVAYQQTLCFWMNYFLAKLNIKHITVVEVSPHGRSKESRIRQLISEIYAGNYYITDPATRRAFTWQASMYKIGKKKNKDDVLDACAYGLDVRNGYWHLIVPVLGDRFKVNHDVCSVEHNSCF